MTTPLRTFTGFKGKIAFAQIDKISFVLMAKNTAQLETLWAHIMANAGPLDPAGIKSAILIEAAILPDVRPTRPTSPTSPTTTTEP